MVINAALNYWHETLLPSTMAVWLRLDVPQWKVYQPAFQQCASDVWNASQSSAQLAYLTFRPLAVLCWMILEILWHIAQVLFRVLLSQGWIQLQRGLLQLKEGSIWFYHFQMSLSRIELLGEMVLVWTLIGLFYFYKWVRRQTYWQRLLKWCTLKKLNAIKVSRFTVKRVCWNLMRLGFLRLVESTESLYLPRRS
jgi:hypothetical protein